MSNPTRVMRSFLLLLFAVCVAFCIANPALDTELIDAVNSQRVGWTAAVNDRFKGISLEETKRLFGHSSDQQGCGAKCNSNSDCSGLCGTCDQTGGVCSVFKPAPASFLPEVGQVPPAFDSRVNWPGCVGRKIRDQHKCGGCWAFATVEILSDRFCIASGGKVNVSLSVDDLMGCWVDKLYNFGCKGGVPEVWPFGLLHLHHIQLSLCGSMRGRNICPRQES